MYSDVDFLVIEPSAKDRFKERGAARRVLRGGRSSPRFWAALI
jgi:hypothetical protein